MSALEQTVTEFGQSLGLDDLQLHPQRGVVLTMENIGTLAFNAAGTGDDAVLISLARRLHRPSEMAWNRILARTHFRARNPLPVQAGVWRDELVLAVVVPSSEFTLPRIHESIQTLDRCHRMIEDAP